MRVCWAKRSPIPSSTRFPSCAMVCGEKSKLICPRLSTILIGLHVASHQRIDGVLAITGTDPEGRNCLILWRNLDETDHAALDAWFDRNREQFAEPLDIIYANGDQTLNAMLQPGENWTAKTIEPIFRELMFVEASDGR